jgi:hypothetical protein
MKEEKKGSTIRKIKNAIVLILIALAIGLVVGFYIGYDIGFEKAARILTK